MRGNRLAKVFPKEAAAQAQGRLLIVNQGHLTFVAPAELRPLLFARRDLLGVVAHAAPLATIEAIGTRCRKYPPMPGTMATVHTFGRDLRLHVHVHVLCTADGRRRTTQANVLAGREIREGRPNIAKSFSPGSAAR